MTRTTMWKARSEPFDEHPWVLLTLARTQGAADLADSWMAQGYEVYVCEGPHEGHSCPLVRGEGCRIAEQAHLVVNGLPVDPTSRELLAALAEHHPDLPVVDAG